MWTLLFLGRIIFVSFPAHASFSQDYLRRLQVAVAHAEDAALEGPVIVWLAGNRMIFDVPAGIKFVPVEPANELLELLGDDHLKSEGLLLPVAGFNAELWVISIQWWDIGFSSDERNARQSPDFVLHSFKGTEPHLNVARRRIGLSDAHVRGLLQNPIYDSSEHYQDYAVDLKIDGSEEHFVMYIRNIFGREGFISLSFIGPTRSPEDIRAILNPISDAAHFTEGHQYGDFNSARDKAVHTGPYVLPLWLKSIAGCVVAGVVFYGKRTWRRK
ncbi:MAG: DUF2167 domain-containing protein [Sporolactobacillus sp.]